MAINSETEFDDLQGIIRFAHGRLKWSRFLLLDIENKQLAKQWLSELPITTAKACSPLPEKALQIAFSAEGLKNLGLSEQAMSGFSEAFIAGMTAGNRPRRLGDTGDNAPQNWDWGGDERNMPDVLLMMYAENNCLDQWQQQILNGRFKSAFNIKALLDNNQDTDREPFGFADGISQPQIDWSVSAGKGKKAGDHFSNRLALGEIVLGYTNEYGQYTHRPLLHRAQDGAVGELPDALDHPGLKDLGRNGSYLIFRQLEQDVHGFWHFLDKVSDGDAQKREQLAEAMVGRKRDGMPLIELKQEPIRGMAEKYRDKNNFDYNTDPHGLVCPVGAHIRRSNPRTGDYPHGVTNWLKRLVRSFGFGRNYFTEDLIATARFHRILRRGRAYGHPVSADTDTVHGGDDEKRGLHFICLSANISRQFEFIQNAWIASSKFAGLQNETDPLLGNRQPLADGGITDQFSRPQHSGARRCIGDLPRFVTVRGGGYFFLPGLRALKYIASCSQTSADGSRHA